MRYSFLNSITAFFLLQIVGLNMLWGESLNSIDSMLKAIQISSDTNLVNTLNNLSRSYNDIANYDKALIYSDRALVESKKINFEKGIATSHMNSGVIHWSKGEFKEAKDEYTLALVVFKELKISKGIGNCYNNIGLVYWRLGDHSLALENFLLALKIREEAKDNIGVAGSYNNIGNLYLEQGKESKALEYFQKAYDLNLEAGNTRSLINNLINIGIIYNHLENSQKALETFTKALEENSKINNPAGIAAINANMGISYMIKNDLDKALKCFFKVVEIDKAVGNIQGAAIAYTNIASIYIDLKEFDKSKKYFFEAVDIYKQTGVKKALSDTYNGLAELFENTGEYEQALKYHKLYSELKDSMLNEESTRQVEEMNTKYSSDRKDKEIELLNKEKEVIEKVAHEEKKRQQIIIIFVSVVLLLVTAFLLFTYVSYRIKKRLNAELEKLSIVAQETDNGVLICDPEGNIEWSNDGLTKLIGYTFDDLKQKGTTLSELSSNAEIQEAINMCVSNGESISYQALAKTKVGSDKWLQSTLTPIFDQNKNIKKLVVIDTDITERKFKDELIRQKNQRITDSISYALRIQQAILPTDQYLKALLKNYFVYYKPKDIVSGDFYWVHEIDESEILLGVADCTGHGVPGAFMSIMGFNHFEHIVKEQQVYQPARILNALNNSIVTSLKQTDAIGSLKDGMDIALCKINFKSLTIEYAGAHNSLYIIRGGELIEIKADRRSIGISAFNVVKEFTNHTFKLEKNDCIYLFTDGYVDQKGGAENEKFYSKSFKQLLCKIAQDSMGEQFLALENTMNKWMASAEQIDDILVFGLKI